MVIELFFAFRLSIRVGSVALRLRTVMLLLVVSPDGKLTPELVEALDMDGII